MTYCPDNANESADRPATDEITERMMIAGMEELYKPRGVESEYAFVARIYRAMRAAQGKE